jgi:hypothetical protein
LSSILVSCTLKVKVKEKEKKSSYLWIRCVLLNKLKIGNYVKMQSQNHVWTIDSTCDSSILNSWNRTYNWANFTKTSSKWMVANIMSFNQKTTNYVYCIYIERTMHSWNVHWFPVYMQLLYIHLYMLWSLIWRWK